MTTDPYGDADLVALYDVDNPAGVDHGYYRALAETLNARRIIDLGCGTGLLTRALARPGRSVTGIDPSRTMIDWARRQLVLPTGEDRVYTSIMHFRDADAYRSALHGSGFEDIDVDGGWTGDAATTTSSLLVFRARRA